MSDSILDLRPFKRGAQGDLFAYLEPGNVGVSVCTHTRHTTRAVHDVRADGRACNHDITCDVCGVVVATESWNLARSRAAHDAEYPPCR